MFFKTEENDIYRTVFGLKQMRNQLCKKLKNIDAKDQDYTNASTVFKVFMQSKNGIIYQTMQKPGEVCPRTNNDLNSAY